MERSAPHSYPPVVEITERYPDAEAFQRLRTLPAIQWVGTIRLRR